MLQGDALGRGLPDQGIFYKMLIPSLDWLINDVDGGDRYRQQAKCDKPLETAASC